MQEINERSDPKQDVKETYYQAGTHWRWGFTPSAEIWNGRLAMIGFLAATLMEIVTGGGYLRFLGMLAGNDVVP